jgi:energy-converting hydrogenase Eha subunit F
VYFLFIAPILDVHQLPGILIVFNYQLSSFLVDLELACREQYARTLAFHIAQVEFQCRDVVVLRTGGRISFAEPDRAIGQYSQFETVFGWQNSSEADVLAQRTGDCNTSF